MKARGRRSGNHEPRETRAHMIKHGRFTLPRCRFRENESLSGSVDITGRSHDSNSRNERENGVTLTLEKVTAANSSRVSPVRLQSRRATGKRLNRHSYFGELCVFNINEPKLRHWLDTKHRRHNLINYGERTPSPLDRSVIYNKKQHPHHNVHHKLPTSGFIII